MTPTSDTEEPQFMAYRTNSHNFNIKQQGDSNYEAKKQEK